MRMIEVWINCPDDTVAQEISGVLISSRAAACSNIYPDIQSSYRWKGKVESESEIPLVVKTRAENFSKIVKLVRQSHPYETPSVIGVPVEYVNDDYLAWVYEETE